MREADGEWAIDLDELFDALKGAKALFINSPNNPTGWMAERAVHCRKSSLHQWQYELDHGAAFVPHDLVARDDVREA